MILLCLFVLGFELLAKWLALSCYAANHPSLWVKHDQHTEIVRRFRQLKGDLRSTAADSKSGWYVTPGFQKFWLCGRGWRGDLLFSRASCRRASNKKVGKPMSAAYHLSFNSFEVTKTLNLHKRIKLAAQGDTALYKNKNKTSWNLSCHFCTWNFPCPTSKTHVKISKILSFIKAFFNCNGIKIWQVLFFFSENERSSFIFLKW